MFIHLPMVEVRSSGITLSTYLNNKELFPVPESPTIKILKTATSLVDSVLPEKTMVVQYSIHSEYEFFFKWRICHSWPRYIRTYSHELVIPHYSIFAITYYNTDASPTTPLEGLLHLSHEPTDYIAIHSILIDTFQYSCSIIQAENHHQFTLLQSLVKRSRFIH
jgi:hypothetical protein